MTGGSYNNLRIPIIFCNSFYAYHPHPINLAWALYSHSICTFTKKYGKICSGWWAHVKYCVEWAVYSPPLFICTIDVSHSIYINIPREIYVQLMVILMYYFFFLLLFLLFFLSFLASYSCGNWYADDELELYNITLSPIWLIKKKKYINIWNITVFSLLKSGSSKLKNKSDNLFNISLLLLL